MKKQQNLRIIPLGGCEEVGRNMTVFEYEKDIVILDMGLQFPEEDMPGIDYVIPNIEYLRGKEKNIQGIIFSHGHLDHIGAAPILLRKLGNPLIIGRPLTIEMIKRRQEDFSKGGSKMLKTIYINNIQEKIHLGSFVISFFQVDHAIMDAVGTIIETPVATIVHPGDWMIEHGPVGRDAIKYTHLARLKKPTILMLESLGAINSEKPVTEKQMLNNLYNLIDSAPGRTIIATFSSQLQRIKQILEYASGIGKKVALDGFSMKLNVEIAKKLGYIKPVKGTIIPIDKINNYPENKVIIICTGAQGEEMSVLSRIVTGNHRFIILKKKDTVIFSSSIIPGNERTVQRLKDNIYRLSDNVFHSEIMDVHISGHSNIFDIKEILRQIKPTYFIPVYANHFILKEAAKIAYNMGFPKARVFIPDNGSIIQVFENNVKILKEKVPTNYVFVDGLGVGDIGEVVLRDRQMLAKDGMFVIVAVVDRQTGQVKGSPDIISRGFIYLKESKELLSQTRKKVINIVNRATGSGQAVNWAYVKDEIRNKIGQFLFSKTERRPIILPVVIEV
ncbi:MAG: ribonuclease J [Candidatus Nealsonbacteria bacterium CG10_big_fil_rev_8_21_14_0_10_36_24]|uniref:Ribonuclease J n=2 Tax=Candidatus Nealsoniibacteriota TaxID=1817911 RepID=A0A2H0YMZ4_9BACT|nr:MAG: ribonuclease J [Candidatus Nealsonbacteria bacterium CG10_big_fil_rev_8_21_14_0_10_36_24]PIS39877.1 MAG: ribonuclease J [Candidatus Nealsonbacteria bacterium CG08_land_8_20_14_0_20_36_22]